MRILVAAVAVVLVAAVPIGSATMPSVPSVKGKRLGKAVKTLVSSGYYADTAPLTSESAPVGTVTRQQPGPGKELARGKPVRLAVSIGPRRKGNLLPIVRIPSVLGKTAVVARHMLVQKKLTMATKFRRGSVAKRGKVIAQNPLGGVFHQYQTVTILVGK
jgi:beta-lactam-binding protein with PASTA domain